jgi:P27 family predicted phage terminase small subunit
MSNKYTLLEKMKSQVGEAASEVNKIVNKGLSSSEKKKLKPIVTLDDEGKKMFQMVLDYLDNSGLLETVDVVTITMLAKNLSIFVMLSREIQTIDDIVQVYENGTSNVSGKMTALSKVQTEVSKLSAKLGLSPMDRARMMGASVNAANANKKSADGDSLDELLNG